MIQRFINYGLNGLNGCPTRNLEGTSAQLLRIPTGDSPSVIIGRLRPKIFGNKSVKSAKSVVVLSVPIGRLRP